MASTADGAELLASSGRPVLRLGSSPEQRRTELIGDGRTALAYDVDFHPVATVDRESADNLGAWVRPGEV